MYWGRKNSENVKLLLKSGSKGIMCNRYPGLKMLAHKDVFGEIIEFAQSMQPEEFKFIPLTFNLNTEKGCTRFEEYFTNNQKAIFIAKPKNGK